MSTEEKIDLLLERMGRLEAAIVSSPAALGSAISLREAMALAGFKSPSAFYRFAAVAKLRPFYQGKYRRDDVLSAMARMAAKAGRAAA